MRLHEGPDVFLLSPVRSSQIRLYVWVAEEVKAPTPIVWPVVKVGSEEITVMNFNLQFYLEWICTSLVWCQKVDSHLYS